MTLTDFNAAFDECRTVAESNVLYKELYAEYDGAGIIDGESWALMEAHRRCMERLIFETKALEASAPRDPNAINPLLIRNWAQGQGIGLAKKGRVPHDVENAYREAHDLPSLPTAEPTATLDDAGVSSGDIRTWARANDIAVGQRGRIHPDIIAKYIAAQKGTESDRLFD